MSAITANAIKTVIILCYNTFTFRTDSYCFWISN